MTRAQWERLEVGDRVVDLKLEGSPTREVLKLSRVDRRRKGYSIRYGITVPNLRQPTRETIFFSTEDHLGDGRDRFQLWKRGAAAPEPMRAAPR